MIMIYDMIWCDVIYDMIWYDWKKTYFFVDESLVSDEDESEDCSTRLEGAENNPFKTYTDAENSATPIDKLYLMQDSYFSQGQ